MNPQDIDNSSPKPILIALAFAAVYIIWGSTYLGIRLVVETMPPFFSAGVRFLIAGAALMGLLFLRGAMLPSRAQWRHAWITGALLLVGGNGLVMWAEKSLSSGRAALLVALAPVWFALLEWLRPGGSRPELKTLVGILVGFLGVIELVSGRGGTARSETSLAGAVAVIAAGICWAAGSLFNRHGSKNGSTWMNAAAQMICGGAALVVLGCVLGEPFRTNWNAVSVSSIWALIYLVIFGSWIGFSAYVWLLKVSTPGKVSTYAYVNPVIAVFLGWAVLGESISAQMLCGAVIILVGVAVIAIPQTFVAGVASRVGTAVRPARADVA